MSRETEKEVDKVLFKEIKEGTEDLLNSVSFMRDELMRHFDREKVVDITSSTLFKCKDLQKKIDRFYGRLKRRWTKIC